MKRRTHIYTNFLCTFLADGCSSVFMGGGSAFIGMDMMGKIDGIYVLKPVTVNDLLVVGVVKVS